MTNCNHQWGGWSLWQHRQMPLPDPTYKPGLVEMTMPPATRDRMCVKCHQRQRQTDGTMAIADLDG